jgi:hypothetical protein
MRIEFLIFLVVCLFALLKFRGNFRLNIIFNLFMYGFYIYLWWMMYQPYTNSHHGDKGLGFAFVTIATIPFYLLINLFNIFIFRDKKDSNQLVIFFTHITGLLLCLTHLIAFLYMIY